MPLSRNRRKSEKNAHFFHFLTNDCAERGVKLIDDFKNSTQNEQQRQYVFQIVEHHRRMLSSLNKENLQSVGRKL